MPLPQCRRRGPAASPLHHVHSLSRQRIALTSLTRNTKTDSPWRSHRRRQPSWRLSDAPPASAAPLGKPCAGTNVYRVVAKLTRGDENAERGGGQRGKSRDGRGFACVFRQAWATAERGFLGLINPNQENSMMLEPCGLGHQLLRI